MNQEEEIKPDPALLFRSFLLVAGAYVANLVLLFLVIFVVSPETIEILGMEPAEYQKILDNEPEKIFSQELFWILLIASGITCSALGYLVARLAPLGKFSHAIFFAAILFAQYLQLAIGAADHLRTKVMLLMVVSSVAALVGANMFLKSENADQLK